MGCRCRVKANAGNRKCDHKSDVQKNVIKPYGTTLTLTLTESACLCIQHQTQDFKRQMHNNMQTRNLIGAADILAVVMRICLISPDPTSSHTRAADGSGSETNT